MIVLSGASASGKTEVAKMLAKKYGITKVITTTTRSMRVGEANGRDYFFVSKEEFLQMKEKDLFVETTVYNDCYYGSTKDQIANDKCVIVDPLGLKAYITLNNSSIVTFFLDSEEKTRFDRMLLRGDPLEKAQARIVNDRSAFSPKNIPEVNFHVNSETTSVEEVADEIYKIYKSKLK